MGLNEISTGDHVDQPSTEELRAELDGALQQARDLQTALDSRVVIEQAKGILRERFGLAWRQKEHTEPGRPSSPEGRR